LKLNQIPSDPPLSTRHRDPPLFLLPRGATPRRSPPASILPPPPPVKGRRPVAVVPPFFSLSLAALSSPGEACRAPYTSPRCLLSELVTGASLKPSVDIVHPLSRSSCCQAAPVDLRCRLHIDEHCAGALLLPDLQVDASELFSGRMPVSPSASTVPPPSKKCCRVAPSTTSLAPNPPW
jgi:hypothetical protein